MKSRRAAREKALQVFYQCDTTGDWNTVPSDDDDQFTETLVQGVVRERAALDQRISQAATRWKIERMSRIDRNILRLAAYEILFLDDIPVEVSINEAVELAKRYSTSEAAGFVNGVLDRLSHMV